MSLLQMFAGRAVSSQVWRGIWSLSGGFVWGEALGADVVFLVMLRVLAWQEWAGNGPGCAHGARATLSVQKEFAHGGPCPSSQCPGWTAFMGVAVLPRKQSSWAFKLTLLYWQRLWKKCGETTVWCWTVFCFSNWFSLCWHRNPLRGRLFSAGMGLSSLV